MLEHCTCSVVKGVLGECLKSEVRSTRNVAIQTAFNKQHHNNKLFKKMTVVVRQTLKELHARGANLCQFKDCHAILKKRGKVSYRKAIIVEFLRLRHVRLRYLDALSKLGGHYIGKHDIC